MKLAGFLVSVPTTPMVWATPDTCACCGAPPTRWALARPIYPWRARGFPRVPYCTTCFAGVSRQPQVEILSIVLSVAIGTALGAAGYLLGFLPAWVCFGVPVALSIIAAWWLLSHRPLGRPKPLCAPLGDGVWLSPYSSHELICISETWARAFASMHGLSEPKPLSLQRRSPLLLAGFFSACAALLASGWAFNATHPSVHVDTGGSRRVQLWVDGAPDEVLSSRESVLLPQGRHVLGWSEPRASAPISSLQVNLTSGAALYSPGAKVCYKRVVAIYGDEYDRKQGSPMFLDYPESMLDGPLEVKEFFSFERIDDWFVQSPSSVSGDETKVRVALLRDEECTRLVQQGCDKQVVLSFQKCRMQAEDDSDQEQCVRQARSRCSAKEPDTTPQDSQNDSGVAAPDAGE